VRQTRNSSSGEPISQTPSESSEERAAHRSQSADHHDTNKGSENGLADSPLQESFIGTTQEELHSHQRSSKSAGPFEKWEREEMEKLLSQLNGQLGMYRYFDRSDD
jgi:phospholipase D1/2